MSYWISLRDHTQAPYCNYEEGSEDPSRCTEPCYPVVQVRPHSEGGTYDIDGTDEAEMDVTYNYSSKFNFRGLHGRTGEETLQELTETVIELGNAREGGYWQDTDGNVGYACSVLAVWASENPQATWHVN